MKSIHGVICFFVILLVATSCDHWEDIFKNGSAPIPRLRDYTSVGTQSATTLKSLVSFSGYNIDGSIFKNDVELYKVNYLTKFQNEIIVASGLIVLPKTDQPVGILSYQRPTITLQSEAPSNQQAFSTDALLYSAISSAGFIAVIPDMIGFGISDNTFHPYYIQEPTAAAVSDMIMAARELAAKMNLNLNGKLFLAGYSQGGYATMAAHKAIEASEIPGTTLVASFPAAGGFDIKGVQEYLFTQAQYSDPYFLAYLADSYQLYYQKNNLLADVFNAPYASVIPGLFDGLHSSNDINAKLTTSMTDLISADALSSTESQNHIGYFFDLLETNSLVNQWYPKNQMYIYHGQNDSTVPYANSESTYQKLIANGASSDQLHLVTLQGDHVSSVKPYVEDFVAKIMTLK